MVSRYSFIRFAILIALLLVAGCRSASRKMSGASIRDAEVSDLVSAIPYCHEDTLVLMPDNAELSSTYVIMSERIDSNITEGGVIEYFIPITGAGQEVGDTLEICRIVIDKVRGNYLLFSILNRYGAYASIPLSLDMTSGKVDISGTRIEKAPAHIVRNQRTNFFSVRYRYNQIIVSWDNECGVVAIVSCNDDNGDIFKKRLITLIKYKKGGYVVYMNTEKWEQYRISYLFDYETPHIDSAQVDNMRVVPNVYASIPDSIGRLSYYASNGELIARGWAAWNESFIDGKAPQYEPFGEWLFMFSDTVVLRKYYDYKIVPVLSCEED